MDQVANNSNNWDTTKQEQRHPNYEAYSLLCSLSCACQSGECSLQGPPTEKCNPGRLLGRRILQSPQKWQVHDQQRMRLLFMCLAFTRAQTGQ